MIQRFSLLALVALFVVPGADPVTGPAGVYSVTTTGPTKVTSGAGWVRIEWEVEPTTPEPPPPGPTKPEPPVVVTPPPAPTPTTAPPRLDGQVFMLAVYDQVKASSYPPAQQSILLPSSKGGSATIGKAMEGFGISWQPREINDPVLASPGTGGATWHDEAVKAGMPCVIAIGHQGGKVAFWTGPLPGDEAAAVSLGKQLTGK